MSSATVPGIPARSVVEVLQRRALLHGDRTACTFLVDGELDETHVTYAALDARARGVAARLLDAGAHGERAILFLPSGLDFVAAFFGCLYAGTLAVPFSAFRRRSAAQARGIIADCGARLALTTGEGRARLAEDPRFRDLTGIVVDECAPSDADLAAGRRHGPASDDDVAYVQYTSGSTRDPRGVTIGHGQLLRHAGRVWRAFDQSEQSIVVSWLPLFHDMGLVGALVAPLTFGARTVLMSPWHFLTRPIRWLAAVSRHRATSSGAPNFAYDLCVARTTQADRLGLDLASWTTAFNGAEPVRAATLDRFAAAFEPHGFRRAALRPCYGLAEATLLVTAGGGARPIRVEHVARTALEAGRIEQAAATDPTALALVGCGAAAEDDRVCIVDPGSRTPVGDRAVGEVWVSGPGVSTRYWNQPADGSTFGAFTSDGAGPFLRTGDLGYLDAGELFVTGRLKDLLTIRGRNFHAADIEAAIQEDQPVLAATRSGVFSVDRDDGEALVVVQEVPRGHAADAVDPMIASIRRTLSVRFGLGAVAIVAVRAGTIPRTTSGKTMRYVCRQQFLSGRLAAVRSSDEVTSGGRSDSQDGEPGGSYAVLLDRLRGTVASALGIDRSLVDVHRAFADFGVSSLQLAEIAGGLERDLARRLEPSVLYAHPTLDALARHLAGVPEGSRPRGVASDSQAIAIVGLACRFPGAPDAEAFWDLLRDGGDAITEVPPDRWTADEFYDPALARTGTTNTKWGGFLANVDGFDSAFFGIPAAEADSMDPQQRLLLETAWDALEDAGITRESLKGSRTGVFVGISTNDYVRVTGADRPRTDLFWCTGSAFSVAANRVSYFLDLRGPSLAVDTACSSSLVALHLACRSLRAGESTLALAGGVNVILSPEITINMSQAGATSGDGRCKAFDARADGLVRGEGVGVVVLKPLAAAIADGDRVYAVVRGTAVNHDGFTNGLTAPNPEAQAAVIRDACADAGIVPESVQVVEAHGPGTVLGDPIELDALASVVSGPGRTEPCRIGSVKTNIGHLEAAAGIAAIIKVALALDRRQIPPSLHFTVPNPRIPFAAHKLSVVASLEPWVPAGSRRAGVSGFGFGGTNVHAVLEGAPPAEHVADVASPVAPFEVVALSARSKPALKALASAYRDRLLHLGDVPLSRIARAAAARRSRHPYRVAVVGRTGEEVARRLDGFLEDAPDRLVQWGEPVSGASAGPVFAFSGFEAVSPARFRELLKHAAFRRQIEACDELTRERIDWSIAESFERDPTESVETGDESLVRSQIRLFAVQVSLAALWREWGVEPAAVVGHSVGEIAAAVVAGALDLPQAFGIVQVRSQLLEDHLAGSPGHGAMAAVRLSAEDTGALLEEYGSVVEIAAHNGPMLTVCAGRRDALDEFLARLGARGVERRLLSLPGPGHTSFVIPVQQTLVDLLAGLRPRRASIPIFSTATGMRCEGESLDAAHWAHHLRAHVSFVEAIESAIHSGFRLFLEIGTQAALSPCIAGVLRVARTPGAAVPSLREQQAPHEALASAAAHLFVSGCPAAWGRAGALVPWTSLPRYPWQRRRHWVAAQAQSASAAATASSATGAVRERLAAASAGARPHPVLGVRLPGAPAVSCWQRVIDAAEISWLGEHRVGGMPLMPATGYLKLASEAVREAHGLQSLVMEDVQFERALFLAPGETRVVQTTLYDHAGSGWRFEIHGAPADKTGSPSGWTRHACGRILPGSRRPANGGELARLQGCEGALRDPESLYEAFRTHGVAYGPSFARVTELRQLGEREALARVRGSAPTESTGLFDPAALDACLQPMALTIPEAPGAQNAAGAGPAYLPSGIRRAEFAGTLPAVLWSHVASRTPPAQSARLEADATIFAEGGGIVASIEGFSLAPTAPALAAPLLRVAWQPRESTASVLRPGRWAILSDGSGIGPQLLPLLQARGVPADLIVAGSSTPTDFGEAAGVVDLRGAAANLPAGQGDTVARAVSRVCASALDAWRGTAARSGSGHAPAFWIVTRGAVAVQGDETPSVVQHPLWALARTLAVEEARIWGGIVDLQPGASDEQNAHALCATLLDGDDDDQVAWRNGRRYVARLAPAEPTTGAAVPIRAGGTYLVTGGLGELGLQVASWLVQQGARGLLLIGRTGLPPRAQWRSLGDSTASYQVDVVRSLEARGVHVHVADVDVSSATALGECLDVFRDEAWPDIAGVFHLAGVVRPAPLRDVDEPVLMEHFAAKIAGAWNLHQYFERAPLDFFVLFSSGSALLGSPGIGAYAAGNAFLDALAARRRAEGGQALSINWGFWSESGMAARLLRTAPDRPLPRGIHGLTNRDALGLLGGLLGSQHASVGVMPVDWDEWSAAHPATASRCYLRLLTTARTDIADDVSIGRDDVLLAAPGDRPGIVERYLCERLARILQVDPAQLERDQPLTQLGIDSLMAVELKNRVEADLRTSVPMVALLQGGSIGRLAQVVLAAVTDEAPAADDTPPPAAAAPAPDSDEARRLLSELEHLPMGTVEELIGRIAGADPGPSPQPGGTLSGARRT